MGLWYKLKLLPTLVRSFYFNFHYLPLQQAIKFPIFVGKMHVVSLKGKVVIDNPNIRMGMIRLVFCIAHTCPDSGVSWQNEGSKVVFKGNAVIGNNTFLCFGSHSTIVFGDDFVGGAGFRLVSTEGMIFGKSVRFGWDTLIMDSNMHPLWDMNSNCYRKSKGKISIGDYNWFATGVKVLHSVTTPERCIWGMNSVVTKGSEIKSYCLMGGSPSKILQEGVMRKFGEKEDNLPF